ncbi:MAG: hypothetical protein Q9167_004533 [Letrouitia subvulpina]
MAPTVAPFGTWDSPISADLLASEGVSLVQIAPNASKPKSDPHSPDKIYYVEGRPAEQGRFCIVECTFVPNASAQLRDVLPQEYSARTWVHGYGGGAFTRQYNNNLAFSDGKTNGVYSMDPRTMQVDCIIAGDDKVFYGDLDARDDILQRWILAIREDHRSETVVNSIVAIDIKTGTVHTVVSGADFYTHPQLSVAANRQAMICWMQWNHPDMPWTGSQLFIASWTVDESSKGETPRVDAPICISGRPGSESVAQPKWNYEDGSLLFCNDISGYWQLYRLETGSTTPALVRLRGLEEGNFAGPEWWLGSSSFAFLDHDTIVALWTKNAVQRLVMVDLQSSSYEFPPFPPIENQTPSLRQVSGHHFAFIGSTPNKPDALYSVASKHQDDLTIVKSSSNIPISATYYSEAEPISFQRTHGPEREELSHAMFIPPKNPGYNGRHDELPPLIISMHGGPTAEVGPGLNIEWQYWTTRGYALAAVNYSGSSGYSRTYRTGLDGQWGIADVADAASCVEHLASAGLIDRTRVGIMGGSAGGYACLQALCSYPDMFAGGVSLYGISDVKALIQETEKFESHYADRLLFGANRTPSDREKEQILHARSPLYHAERIKAATLLLQGLEDRIVPPNQTQGMADVIKKHNGDVKVIFFEGEGHGFLRAESLERSITAQEQWWRKTLVRDAEV